TAARSVPTIVNTKVNWAKPSRGIGLPATSSETPAACAMPATAVVAAAATRPEPTPVRHTGRTVRVRVELVVGAVVGRAGEAVSVVAVMVGSLRRARLVPGAHHSYERVSR